MRCATATTFRAALLERLRADAERTGTSPEQLRNRVVFARRLARVARVAPDRWALNGGIGLALRRDGRIHAAHQQLTKLTRGAGLTSHELEVLLSMSAGRTDKEIAGQLAATGATVKSHIRTAISQDGDHQPRAGRRDGHARRAHSLAASA